MKFKLALIPLLISFLLACDNTGTGQDLSPEESASVTNAQAFVAEIKALGDSVTLTSAKAFGDNIKGAFLNEAQMSDEFLNEDFATLLRALRIGMKALKASFIDFDITNPSAAHEYVDEDNDATINVTRSHNIEDGFQFVISGMVEDTEINLTASVMADIDILALLKKELVLDSIDLSLTGTADNTGAQLNISQGEFSINFAPDVESDQPTDDEDKDSTTSLDMESAFEISITQKETEEVSNPITYTGSMNMSLNELNMHRSGSTKKKAVLKTDKDKDKDKKCHKNQDVHKDKHDKDCDNDKNFSIKAITFDSFSINMSGTLEDTQGNAFTTTLEVIIDGSNFDGQLDFDSDSDSDSDSDDTDIDIDIDSEDEEGSHEIGFAGLDPKAWDGDWFTNRSRGQDKDFDALSFNDNFTETNYIGFEIIFSMKAQLADVEEDATFTVHIARSQPGTGVLDMELNIDGKTFTANHGPDQEGLHVISADGIELDLDFRLSDDGEHIGEIIADELIVATISKVDGDIVILYIDGTYDSF